jgi:very-short-patch-repair endonuclease
MVSQVLPARTTFDVVIFDEASQITPADAITSIFRGRQLVVAGDERQLPPSPFFVSETTEDEDELEEVPQKTVSEQLAGTVGFESVLDALIPMLPFRWLQWHYRSQDERLIAFSNAHIYDRVLVTFPGIGGDICVEHVAVPSELSEETNSPASEVRVVVDLILRHAASRPAESLGVIAMGIKHAQRVDEALRTTLKERPEFETFFAEDRDEPFFVKNLERVQGDERDAIILSIGYGKNPRGQLVYRFGPLLVSGGERRLNVAITRAKKRMTLVSSFTSADMDPDKLNSEGMRLLRQYVQYMEHGGRTLGDVMLEKPPLNPFEIDVRDTLAARRLNLIPQYGVSGFRIDFAVTHPLQRGRMVLAIECDGASYHSSESARERDRLRQEHLERLGWTFHRIWSSEWFADKQAATDKAVAAYEGAIADGAEPPQTVLPPPPPVVGGSAAAPTRRLPRPQFSPGYTIAEYSRRTLDAVVAWVQSDGLLRTRAELTDEAIRELGFERRGKNIVAAVSAAVDRVLRSPPSTSV